MPFGPVPLPDAVVEPEDRAREQARVVLRDRALRASRATRKLAQANSRSRVRARAAWRACSSRGELLRPDEQPLLGDEHAVAQDVVLGEVEAVLACTAASALERVGVVAR